MNSTASNQAAASVPTATLDEVDIRDQLATRPAHTPNYEQQQRAFSALAQEMMENPRNMLQRLAELAVQLCDAHTAGISLLEGPIFRWEAVAGVFASARGGSMPRDESPSGVCIDRDATQLMYLADRCFPALPSEPRFVESLLIPFHSQKKPIGTVWVVSHDTSRHFDPEDERLVRGLAQFAAAGWQLLKANDALIEESKRETAFLATLNHELRSPFGAITLAARVLEERVAEDAGSKRAVNVILRQSRHVSRLIEDLLDITRAESGKLHLETTSVDLRKVVVEAVETSRFQMERREHILTVDLGSEPVVLDADPDRLDQIVTNLLDNAAKYTPKNGRVSVGIRTDGEVASVIVQDSGVGIHPDHTESIFKPFKQLSVSHRDSAGGLGLGLALVRCLVELHGGSVEVASQLGKGSCFTVRLRLKHHPKPTDEDADDSPSSSPASVVRVLSHLDGAE